VGLLTLAQGDTLGMSINSSQMLGAGAGKRRGGPWHARGGKRVRRSEGHKGSRDSVAAALGRSDSHLAMDSRHLKALESLMSCAGRYEERPDFSFYGCLDMDPMAGLTAAAGGGGAAAAEGGIWEKAASVFSIPLGPVTEARVDMQLLKAWTRRVLGPDSAYEVELDSLSDPSILHSRIDWGALGEANLEFRTTRRCLAWEQSAEKGLYRRLRRHEFKVPAVFFPVLKSDGLSARSILAPRVNEFLPYPHPAGLPHTHDMLRLMAQYSYAITKDGDSFFHQFPVGEGVSHLFSVRVREGQGHGYWGPTTLPMGYCPSVFLAQGFWKVAMGVTEPVPDTCWLTWVDNLILLAKDQPAAEKLEAAAMGALAEVGCQVHEEGRGPRVKWTGLMLDLEKSEYCFPSAWTEKALGVLHACLLLPRLPILVLQKLVGLCVWALWATQHSLLFIREGLLRDLSTHWAAEDLVLSDRSRSEVEWVARRLSRNRPVPLDPTLQAARGPSEQVEMYTDASMTGGGCVVVSDDAPHAILAWAWDDSLSDAHITLLELLAIVESFERILHSLKGRRVLVRCDNTAVVAVVSSWYTRADSLSAPLRVLYDLVHDNNIALSIVWVPTLLNLADEPSRRAWG
jgi:hypothetical protein